MEKKHLPFILIPLFLFMASCTGETGDTGPAGPEGEGGESVIMAVYQDNKYPSDNYIFTEDGMLYSPAPYTNMGACDYYRVGVYNDGEGVYRCAIRFDLTSIAPDNVKVKAAYLTMTIHDTITHYGSTTISAYSLTRAWTEGDGACFGSDTSDVSWECYSGTSEWNNEGGDFDPVSVSDSVAVNETQRGVITLEIDAETVESWISTDAENYGFILKAQNETTGTNWFSMYSRNYSEAEKRPKLTVYYTLP